MSRPSAQRRDRDAEVTNAKLSRPFEAQPGVGCPKCSTVRLLDFLVFPDFFDGRPPRCASSKCKQEFDLIEALLADIKKKDKAPGIALSVAGCTSTVFAIELVPDEVNVLDFESIGVPEDARYIHLDLSTCAVGDQGYLPLVVPERGSTAHPVLGRTVRVYPTPIPPAPKLDNPSGLNKGTVTWAHRLIDESPFIRLVDAFAYFAAGDYATSVIRSQTAVEEMLTYVVNDRLPGASIDIRSDPIERAGHEMRMTVLLPVVARLRGVKPLDRRIWNWALDLYRVRNQLAHSGRAKVNLSQGQVAQHLCAALVLMQYVFVLNHDLRPVEEGEVPRTEE
ncbi:MAG TPA: hypothetical protein VF728_00835 [Nocardioides sp.]